MESYVFNKGVDKDWEFKGIVPTFCLVGVGLIGFIAFFLLLLHWFAGILVAAAICFPLSVMGLYSIVRLNKRFGERGFQKWISRRRQKKTFSRKSIGIFFPILY